MPDAPNTLEPIVTDELGYATQQVIQQVRRNTTYPFLLDAKLGDAGTTPLTDAQMASTYNTPLTTVIRRATRVTSALTRTDLELGNPLAKVAQRANKFMERAAIINHHKRHPPLYSESTIKTFIKLGYAEPEHAPLIRAAGYVVPPPTVPTDHDISFVIFDIATHLSRSHQPQSPEQILDAISHHQDTLNRWSQLDVCLFTSRVSGIFPDDAGRFDPDQPWGNFVGRQQLVANTMIRILSRDRQPRSRQYMTEEVSRLVRHLLPDGYNILNAIHNVTWKTDEISWQGPATFGLTQWDTNISAQNTGRRGRTGDLVYTFLVQQGPAEIDDVIKHVQETTEVKKRTITDAIKNDPENQFLRIDARRIAANPIPRDHNPDGPALMVIPDARQQCPILWESELLWLTWYVQGLNELATPLPSRVAITGPRAAGFTNEADTLEITVVADPSHRPNLEPQLAEVAATATGSVPSVRPNIRFLSTQQWANQQGRKTPFTHHNVWLAPEAT